MTAANPSAGHSGLSIGAVLAQLKPDFPDLSISKIRFLESEDLVIPRRTPSGYRQFTAADIERLRYVLTAQRDKYLPLKVIKEQLDAIDNGDVPVTSAVPLPRSLVSTDTLHARDLGDGVRGSGSLSRQGLLDAAGVGDDQLAEFEQAGLVTARANGSFDGDSLLAAQTLAQLSEVGLQVRHLRSIRATAEREATMISSLLGAHAARRGPGAKEATAERAANHAATVLRLHALLLKNALRNELGT